MSDEVWVEIEEDLIRDGRDKHVKGERKLIEASKARNWIKWGWARDAETGEIGERKPGAQPVVPDKVVQQA